MARLFALVTFLLLLAGGPAFAHGGPIKLEVQGDGGQNVNTTVTYQNDGHMVTDQVILSYTAVTADGRTVGPIRMVASAEGQAFYVSEKPLPIGSWTVTVTATHPSYAQRTVAVTSAVLPAVATASAETGSAVLLVITVNSVAMIAVFVTAVILFRRSRRRSALTSQPTIRLAPK